MVDDPMATQAAMPSVRPRLRAKKKPDVRAEKSVKKSAMEIWR